MSVSSYLKWEETWRKRVEAAASKLTHCEYCQRKLPPGPSVMYSSTCVNRACRKQQRMDREARAKGASVASGSSNALREL